MISRERELGPVLDDITVPARYVVASGTSFGSRGDEQERRRTSLDSVTACNPNIQISAKVAGNHGAILRRDFPAIAEAVRETWPPTTRRSAEPMDGLTIGQVAFAGVTVKTVRHYHQPGLIDV